MTNERIDYVSHYHSGDNCLCLKELKDDMKELASEVTASPYNDWITGTRWHIDDVKMAIQGSEYKDKPMPSDRDLYEYLSRVVDNDYFIEVVNETIAEQLDDLFDV